MGFVIAEVEELLEVARRVGDLLTTLSSGASGRVVRELLKGEFDAETLARRLNFTSSYIYKLLKRLRSLKLVDYRMADGKCLFFLTDSWKLFVERLAFCFRDFLGFKFQIRFAILAINELRELINGYEWYLRMG